MLEISENKTLYQIIFPKILTRNNLYFQSVPMGSSLTFTIEGDDNENQIEVVQSAPDDNSPLEVKLTFVILIRTSKS